MEQTSTDFISRKFGIGEERARQLVKNTIKKLKAKYEN